jgi:iron complex transport system permease protein
MRDSTHNRFSQVIQVHERGRRKRLFCLAALLLLAVVALIMDLATGPSWLPISEVIAALRGHGSDATLVIVREVRLPTACLAALVGASLSLAGAEMQTILRNPLASPFTLGVSSAAAFGAALVIVLGLSLPYVSEGLTIPVMAFIFAFTTVLVIQVIARRQSADTGAIILFGVAMVFGFNALIAVLQMIAPADSLQQLVFWTMGSLGRAGPLPVAALGIVLAVTAPFAFAAARSLTLLELGAERAESLGVFLVRLRFGCLLRASLLASAAVAFAGTIGFVGLVGPHLARLLVGEDRRLMLPAALLSGAAILSFASVAAKLLIPGVIIPIGIVTTLVGLPFFVILLLRRMARE